MTKILTVKDLKRIGFKKIGEWKVLESRKFPDKKAWKEREAIDHVWSEESSPEFASKKILYAFVFGEEIKYIGKTTKGIKGRLKWYVDPSENGQSTNKNGNKEIYRLVKLGGNDKNMDIWIFTPVNVKYEGFDLDLAAGLEGSLIEKLSDESWNVIHKLKSPSKHSE